MAAPHKVQQLTSEWLRRSTHREPRDAKRGYDSRYETRDLDRERAIEEAKAAAELAERSGLKER